MGLVTDRMKARQKRDEAASWESDHQRRILEALDAEHGTSLTGEFPYGCDTIQHVAEALIALRAERRFTVDEAVEAYRQHLESSKPWGPLVIDSRCHQLRSALTEEPS